MKRSLLTTTTLLLIASFAIPLPSQTAIAQPSQKQVQQQTASNIRSGAVGVLYRYFNAIATGNYQVAYDLLTPQYQAAVPYEEFVRMYQDYIGSISIRSVEPLPNFPGGDRREYRLQFNVSYIKPFPVGNGTVPELFVLTAPTNSEGEWLIDGMAPGQ
ncbi:hypothetical protein [Microseira wollei]|uniref:DUF4864 domain-containing protein n=1 Tax=Microseira wollei NIES-4236 TaxID=2530354 RepID=A0AAV3X1I8_9CYAN|nr:hypothetical protein [Microseira wollei]GET36587.1 hypothetical protein MiSe_13380 [Microseira wollei NIES-4236]